MTMHSFRSHSVTAYGAGLTDILPTCRLRLGRNARFLPFPNAFRAGKQGIKLSSGGTLATIFSRKHDIALITPMTKLAILEYPDPRLRTKAIPVAEGAGDRAPPDGSVMWNFEKFLIAKDGHVAGRFSPMMKPEDPILVGAIEAELAK